MAGLAEVSASRRRTADGGIAGVHLFVSAILLVLLFPGAAAAIPPTVLCMTGECHSGFNESKYIHGPISVGMCPLCHETGSAPADLPSSHPKVLVGDATDKCLICHEGIGALMGLGSVHTPVADGDCIDCHDPHGSGDSFFLKYPSRVESGRRIVADTCKACHEEDDSGWFNEFHSTEAILLDCVVCHNAHGSAEKYQLTRYVRDVYLRSTLQEGAELREKGRLEAAAAAYFKALSVFPDDTSTSLLLAEVYSEGGEWDKAGKTYRKVLESLPDNVDALLGAAMAAREAGDSGAALGFLKQALDTAPESAVAHLQTGLIYMERGQQQEALSELSRAAELDSRSAEAHLRLAEVFEALGRTEESQEAKRRHEDLVAP